MAQQLGLKYLEPYDDLKLLVNQVILEYEIKLEVYMLYHQVAIKLTNQFKQFYIGHVPQHENIYADALASLAATLVLPARITSQDLFCPISILEANEVH